MPRYCMTSVTKRQQNRKERRQTVNTILDVPCFKCLANKEVNDYHCKPEICNKLECWLLQTRRREDIIRCPKCDSSNIVRHGFYRYNKKREQRHGCKQCGAKFVRTELLKFKTSKEIILFAFTLEAEGYTTRDISKEIRKKFNHKISHVTIAKWIQNKYLRTKLLLGR